LHIAAAKRPEQRGNAMAWTTPTLVEVCIGLEINGYLPAEF
jgi:coenzyme PQQ precursor peptide PqqA